MSYKKTHNAMIYKHVYLRSWYTLVSIQSVAQLFNLF